MDRQFQAPFQINPNAEGPQQRSLAQLNQTVSGIGDEALQYRQKQIENQRQKMMMDIQQAQSARQGAQTRNELGYDPGSGEQPPTFDPSAWGVASSPSPMAPSPSSSMPQGTMGPQPNMSMESGGAGYAPPGPSTMPQPMHAPGADLTSHFQSWMSQGQPMTYSHPEMGGGAQPQNGMDIFNTMRGIPGTANQKLFLSAQDEARKQREDQLKYPGGASSQYYTPDQAKVLLGPKADALVKAYPGGYVPKDAVHQMLGGIHFDMSQGFKGEELSDKQLSASQSGFSKDANVVKAQGTLDKITQAIPLLQSGQIDNATAKQALTTAMTYMATGGQRVNDVELRQFGGAQTLTNRMGQWVKSLDAGTLTPRDAQDMAQVLGVFQRSAQATLQKAGERYSQQYIQRSKNGRGMPDVFKDVTGMDYTQTGSGGQGGGQPMTAVNRKTGQRIQSTDGGKTWTVAQ